MNRRLLLVVALAIGAVVVGAMLVRGGASGSVPEEARIRSIDGHAQERNLSCESASASDLAAYWGVPVSESDFLTQLPRSDNPHKGFVGDVDDDFGSTPPNGYGVYAEPIAAQLREHNLETKVHYGKGLSWLREQLSAERPVIVWASYELSPYSVRLWQSADGETSKVIPYEHTYLAIGYDPSRIQVLDPYDGEKKWFAMEDFLRSWSYLDQMAVVVTGRRPASADRPLLPTLAVAAVLLGLTAVAVRARPRPEGGRTDLLNVLDEEAEFGYARALGIVFLVVGLFVVLQLGTFNPFFEVPLMVACGFLGFLLGFMIQNR